MKRPYPWPVALAGSVLAFLATSLIVAGLLRFLLLPQNPEMVELAGPEPVPKQQIAHAGFGMIIGFAIGRGVYATLRGEDVAEALADSIWEVVKIGVVTLVWVGAFLTLLWMTGHDGFVGALGLVLLAIFALASLKFYAAMYQEHTPPYPSSQQEEVERNVE